MRSHQFIDFSRSHSSFYEIIIITINYHFHNHYHYYHRHTNHRIDWDSAKCFTYSTNHFQRLTLESWFTNLEQTPLNRCQQLPAPYKRLINDVNKPTNRPTNNRRIETDHWLLTNSTRVFQPITSRLNWPITFNRPDFITSSTDNYSSLDSEDDFRTGCRNVSHQQQFFSELHSPERSHYTNYWYSWVQTIYSIIIIVIIIIAGIISATNAGDGIVVGVRVSTSHAEDSP